jgi:hypothetical protein
MIELIGNQTFVRKRGTTMEYTVIFNEKLEKLINQVNQALKSGWRPLGGIAVTNEGLIFFYYYQAMVREP